ncbi:MAG: bifunctional folylpolyglutamate synthase/dihydrofolate synthase [Haliscomenobacteraceae bacterium CHB4]|nr:UDP-N-acetylmuramoyl-L-alanyl-D-glutamate--2,6-diaminopimelate ligase [Saprospiraceae bacterium]MCE7924340.1 bifunctional folylpolyglutamate synthase/dihydrofolate synthase [Haliscomenobacteraceae bacterium CHB4]
MTYRETLDFLFAQLPMYHRVGAAAFKKDLTNTVALCEHLNNPHLKFKSIHVGGTNGKGSVSHMLAAVCQAAGLKTGLYISPHYKDFRERIKVNGQYIPRRRVVAFVENNRNAIERIQPSFFELCVAMAFDHFARERVDIAIVEVGLGGRLDSTNVITPLLSVITNISYDHQNMLGDTLPQIAFEKAGIIKPGVPVAVGETHPESAPVFVKKATETGSEIAFADQHFEAAEKRSDNWQSTFYDIFKDKKLYLENLEVDAAGPYQAKNLATAVQAVEMASRYLPMLDLHALQAGLKNLRALTRFIGRWQVIGENPTVLCDSAHNEAGLKLAFEKINQLTTDHRPSSTIRPHSLKLLRANRPPSTLHRPSSTLHPLPSTVHRPPSLHIVTGFVNDKDVDKALGYFPAKARYYFAKANIPRGLEAQLLKEKASAHGLEGRAYASVKNALKAARRAAAPEDLIVVIGSIFVVAEVI